MKVYSPSVLQAGPTRSTMRRWRWALAALLASPLKASVTPLCVLDLAVLSSPVDVTLTSKLFLPSQLRP